MRFTGIILVILVAIVAIKAAPAKENKLVRLPFTKTYKHGKFQYFLETLSNNTTSELGRRGTSTISLTSYREMVWRGTISIGTPRQYFRVIMDTGSGSTWVADDTCGDACGNIDKYNGGASSTFNDLGKPFTAQYDNGAEAAGTWTADNLALGYDSDVIVNQQIFGRANQVPEGIIDADSSGILAMGFRTRVSEENDIPVLIENLYNQGLIDQNVISFHYIKNDDIDAGEILFGGVDQDYIKGDILYTPIVFNNDNLPDWVIPIADIQLAGNSLGKSNVAYLDTGNGDIFVSDDAAQSIYSNIPGAVKDDNYGWIVPAPFPSDVALVVGQRVFTIPAADLVTDFQVGDKFTGTIQGGANNLWVIGDAFIKNHYVIFDFGQNAIGIADRSDT